MIKKKIKNVYRMLRYAYTKDINIKCTNVKYGSDKKQYYKVYKQNSNKPTIFFIHGGGWWQGSPSLYSGVGKYFFKHGYTVVLVGYRLVPHYRYPIQIEDVFKALRHYIKNNDISFVKMKIDKNHQFRNKKLKDINYAHDLLVILIARNRQTIIPNGDTEILEGDLLVLAAKTFENRENIRLDETHIHSSHRWKNKLIKDISLPSDQLIIMIQREDQSIVPN